MGIITSLLWPNTGRTDDPDSDTKLTSRDRYILKNTWAKLTESQAKNIDTGVLLFMTLFKHHPEYKDLFPFRDIPMDELPTNNRFKAHCISVVYSLTSLITNVDSPILLRELLFKQGTAHVPRGVPQRAYNDLKLALSEILESFSTKEELDTWDRFLTLAVQIFLEGAASKAK